MESKGHTRAPSSSLIPTDPSVLFTTAGMQQFKPYYMGEKSPYGDMATSVQKCMRTSDIDEIGDATHLTFFEMLGNFAFNNAVSKRQAIEWGHEFITSEMKLKIDYITIFGGDDITARDSESEDIWKSIDASLDIRPEGRDDVFWGPTGDEGPCGPTTEIYIDGVEIWNIVFNEYYCDKEKNYKKLENFGIDTGMGLERLAVAVQGVNNVFETDLFNNELDKEDRIVADHVRSAVFLAIDGVHPSNTGQGYILRRLIRRAVFYSQKNDTLIKDNIDFVWNKFSDVYEKDFAGDYETVVEVIEKEKKNFESTLDRAVREFEKRSASDLSGKDVFELFTTYGMPFEMTRELAHGKGLEADVDGAYSEFEQHKELSKTASAGKFKGGMSDAGDPQVTKLHTAHHLLLAALQQVLGQDVKQRGSNITSERLRIDFNFDRKMTDDEKQQVNDLVNGWIAEGLPVIKKTMPKDEAEALGAEMEFGVKYPDTVDVYFIENKNGEIISKEFCGGPHITNTSELGTFRIKKEESSSAGVRRIKAVLE